MLLSTNLIDPNELLFWCFNIGPKVLQKWTSSPKGIGLALQLSKKEGPFMG